MSAEGDRAEGRGLWQRLRGPPQDRSAAADVLGWGFLGVTSGATYGATAAISQGYLGTATGRRMLMESINIFGSAGLVYGTARALFAATSPDAHEYTVAAASGAASGGAVGVCLRSPKAAIIAGGCFAALAVAAAMVDRQVSHAQGRAKGPTSRPQKSLWERALRPEELERRQREL